jgi:hypothetical protein
MTPQVVTVVSQPAPQRGGKKTRCSQQDSPRSLSSTSPPSDLHRVNEIASTFGRGYAFQENSTSPNLWI